MSNVYFRYIIDQVHKQIYFKNPIIDGSSPVPWYYSISGRRDGMGLGWTTGSFAAEERAATVWF